MVNWRSCATLFSLILTGAISGLTPVSAGAQTPAPLPLSRYSYAEVADYAVAAATMIDADIRTIRPVDSARAPGLAPGMARYYIEGNVRALIYGRAAIARRIAWLVDRPLDSSGRAIRPRRERVLLFARPVTNPAQVQLVAPGAQLTWDIGTENHVRAVATELARGNPPAAITGISQAFHVPGTIAGEGETQIFLRTASGDPVSLTILRRPGQARRWAVAFGEIVDEAARVPQPGSIGHYRLACGLPRALPATALVDATAATRTIASDDYAYVLQSIGPCERRALTPSAG